LKTTPKTINQPDIHIATGRMTGRANLNKIET